MNVSILVVEDYDAIRELALTALRLHGYAADGAADVAEAFERTARRDYDVIIMDYTLPDGHGDDAAKRICERAARWQRPVPHIIGWTASNDAQMHGGWKAAGVHDIRIKSEEGDVMKWLIERIEGVPLVARAA